MSEITAQLAAKIDKQVGIGRSRNTDQAESLKALVSERAIANGVRAQLDAMAKKITDLDDDYQKLLKLAHEAYGSAPRGDA